MTTSHSEPEVTKPIIGLQENVTVFGTNNQSTTAPGKIDTGARTTALDVSIAQAIGLGDVYTKFHKLVPELNITKENYKEMKQHVKTEVTPQLKKQIPGLYDVRLIPATNGITLRPYVEIEIEIHGIKRTTVANIVDRKMLLYPVLVGKVDLQEFLIDPSKNDYTVV